MTKTLLALALGLTLNVAFAAEGAAPAAEGAAQEEAPKAVVEAAAAHGKITTWSKDEDGTYKVTVEKDGETSDLHLDAAGKEVKAETK